MSNLNELKKEVAELEAQLTPQQPQTPQEGQIPQPAQPAPEPNDNFTRFFKAMSDPTLKTIADESLPMAQRVTAAIKWRSQLQSSGWDGLSDLELVESLSNHPDIDRLNELSQLVCYSQLAKGEDWRSFLNELWAAIQEFHELRNKYPLRGAPVILKLEALAARSVRCKDSQHDDYHQQRAEVRSYIAQLQNR